MDELRYLAGEYARVWVEIQNKDVGSREDNLRLLNIESKVSEYGYDWRIFVDEVMKKIEKKAVI